MDHPNTLDQSHYGRQQAAHTLPYVIGGQVLGLETHHERQEGDGGRAVNRREEESQEEEGDTARNASYNNSLLPEETQQEARHGTQDHDHIYDSCFVQGAGPEAMHQSDEERPNVGHLDEDGEVRGQVPALWDLGDDQGQLHPEAVDGDPGAHPEQTCQQVGQEGHVGGGFL